MRRTVAVALLLVHSSLLAQDRIMSWPVWKQHEEFDAGMQGKLNLARFDGRWIDGKTVGWKEGANWIVLDCATGKKSQVSGEPKWAPSEPVVMRRGVGRGGQYTEETAPDGKTVARYREGNVYVSVSGGQEKAATPDGDPTKRLKYGTASWVYGEELSQNYAMGFSPDSQYLWLYRFDESQVVDDWIMEAQATYAPRVRAQAFPKPGTANPVVDLFVYRVQSGSLQKVKVRAGAFDDGMGHYIYDIQWSPDGKELLYRSTDRRQRTMQLCAANPATGVSRVVTQETSPTYAENKLRLQFLDRDSNISKAPAYKGKALWESEKTGFINVELLDLATGKRSPVTKNMTDVVNILRVDLVAGNLYYLAAGENNPYMQQLWVARLDGSSTKRLTDPSYDHAVSLSPTGEYFVDTRQALDTAPVCALVDGSGKDVGTPLATSDTSAFTNAGYSLAERIVYTSPDGSTKLYGTLHKPRNFDPTKKYPLIVDVYGGPLDPHGGAHGERFQRPDMKCGFGFLVAEFANRGTGMRGKSFRDAMYQKMGIVEIDDQAAGVMELLKRPYVDSKRVAVNGTSYGGYSSLMCMLRYPDVYQAASASSCVSDWRNYDTIYTERYMGVLPESKAAYDAGSFSTYAANLKGSLLLYYGTADDNTHPNNTLMVIAAMRRLNKAIEVQVGVDAGHSGVDWRRMLEFFFDRLAIPQSGVN